MILAIDPGNEQSAWVAISDSDYKPLSFGKADNKDMLSLIYSDMGWCANGIAIEMIGHYGTGMPVGESVFDTCVWIGRFVEASANINDSDVEFIKRKTIVNHLCGSARGNDASIKQALVDRFAKGVSNHGKGTKKNPGWFHGFHSDIWQAYALGVTYLDMRKGNKR